MGRLPAAGQLGKSKGLGGAGAPLLRTEAGRDWLAHGRALRGCWERSRVKAEGRPPAGGHGPGHRPVVRSRRERGDGEGLLWGRGASPLSLGPAGRSPRRFCFCCCFPSGSKDPACVSTPSTYSL